MSHFDCPECPDQHARLAAAEARIAELEQECKNERAAADDLLSLCEEASALTGKYSRETMPESVGRIIAERDALRAHVAELERQRETWAELLARENENSDALLADGVPCIGTLRAVEAERDALRAHVAHLAAALRGER